jgi:hypothetical protein
LLKLTEKTVVSHSVQNLCIITSEHSDFIHFVQISGTELETSPPLFAQQESQTGVLIGSNKDKLVRLMRNMGRSTALPLQNLADADLMRTFLVPPQ